MPSTSPSWWRSTGAVPISCFLGLARLWDCLHANDARILNAEPDFFHFLGDLLGKAREEARWWPLSFHGPALLPSESLCEAAQWHRGHRHHRSAQRPRS